MNPVTRWFQARTREKRIRSAARWTMVQAEINNWQVLPADEELATMGAQYQIEAGFHFKVDGEYCGGYIRSVPLTHHEAESKAIGSPSLNVRYNPANPDETVVLAEDNRDNLPFRIVSG